MVEFYCQSLSLYFPYILVLPQLPYLQMILCCQRQQEEQVMKLNDDVLEPTPFQSPFHLTASGNSRRETARSRSGHTHTDTSLSSLASRPLSPSPPQRPLSLSPLPRPWKHLVTGRKGFSGQHPELGAPASPEVDSQRHLC